ncbi:hypothetical protein ACQP00_20870 [Dactylosporangium sp. CS-047395]|uniref:hypothetical protein n=1 Tax=Dactylosporangium sp. CS-047395 TaxID=3239936 RepID=UPI003D8E8673
MLGGIAAVASGGLVLFKAVLDLLVGEPPPTEPQLRLWLQTHHGLLAWTNESLVVAAVLLTPVLPALYRRLDGPSRPWVGFGCGMLAAAISVTLTLGIVHGRLMYPVYGIDLDDHATAALLVSLYYGGAHEATLLVGGALIMLSIAARQGPQGSVTATVGTGAGICQIAGAFPWLTGPLIAACTQATLAAWLTYVGVLLLLSPRAGAASTSDAPPGS